MPKGPTALAGALEARAFEAEDEPGVLELLQMAFGQWPRDIEGATASEFFQWKHMASPFGPSILLVVEADGLIIGFAAYMPWQFRARGQVMATLRGVDFAVHPSYRRLGASMAIREAANRLAEIDFIWSNPNGQSRPGGLKAGRRQVGRLSHFVRPRGRLRDTIRRAYGKGSKTPQRLLVDAEPAAEILADGRWPSRLLEQSTEWGDRLTTVKSLDYLRWRYGRLAEYHAVQTGTSERPSGFAIFRARRHGPFWVSHICELFVERNDRRTTRRLLRRVGDAAATDFLSCAFSSRREAGLLGFVQHRSGTVLMTHPFRQNILPDPTRRDSWALSLGDLELL